MLLFSDVLNMSSSDLQLKIRPGTFTCVSKNKRKYMQKIKVKHSTRLAVRDFFEFYIFGLLVNRKTLLDHRDESDLVML